MVASAAAASTAAAGAAAAIDASTSLCVAGREAVCPDPVPQASRLLADLQGSARDRALLAAKRRLAHAKAVHCRLGAECSGCASRLTFPRPPTTHAAFPSAAG